MIRKKMRIFQADCKRLQAKKKSRISFTGFEKKYFFFAVIAFSFMLVNSGCKIFDREEQNPSFVSFRDPKVLVDSVSPTINVEAGIKDVWLYQDQNFLGVFPFPSTVPITAFNNSAYTIQGGIHESGVSAFRIPYPFWKYVNFTINQNELDTIVISPQFEYLNDSFIKFSFYEDFENPSFQFSHLIIADSARMNRATGGSFEGAHHSIAYFDSTHKVLSVVSDPLPPISKNIDIYAEITFRSDFDLVAGMYYEAPQVRQIPEVGLLAKNEWTTVYIHLVKIIRDAPADPSIQFRLWLYANGNGGSGTVEFDHIRVVQFKE